MEDIICKSKIGRRKFMAGSAAAVAAPMIVPSSVFGADAPSNRITVGVLGMGDRGPVHANSFQQLSGSEVLAVCDPVLPLAVKNQKAINQRAGTNSCEVYQDFREVLARDDIDAITVAAPENWHAVMTVMAAQAGKDIYCEKAISLTVAEGRAMCDAVRRHGRILQVGTQQRSGGRFRYVCDLVRNGYIGKLKEVRVGVPGGRALQNAGPKAPPADVDYDLWLGPAQFTPYNDLKCRFNWYFMSDYCAGWIQSWGVHHCDIAMWGAPGLGKGKVTVEGTATFPEDGIADTSITWKTSMTTESGLLLSFASNNTPGHGQGCRFIGEKGWLHVSRGGARSEPKSLLKIPLKPEDSRLYISNHHFDNFLDCVRSRRDPVAPIEAGHRATTTTLIADIATRLGRKLTWDWQTESFVNDVAANQMLKRSMRAPWRV